MKSVDEILNEAFKCHKSAEMHFENGNYMAWQQLLTKEKSTFMVYRYGKEIRLG